MMDARTARIRTLNDAFRRSLLGGRVVTTAGIAAIPAMVRRVQCFNAFDAENDPYGEHDFGIFEEHGYKVYWKIDYFDPTMDGGSEDPADPAKTMRVLTIMLAEEY